MTRDEKKTKMELIAELAELRDFKRRHEAAAKGAPAGDSASVTEKDLSLSGAITEQVSDSVIATDLGFQIIYTNRAFRNLFGYTTEEMLGRTPDFLNAEPLAPDIQREIYETVASGETWRRAVLNMRKDGSTFTCDLAIFPLVDEHGDIFAYAGTQRDITERERVAKSLVESEEKFRLVTETIQDVFWISTPGITEMVYISPAFETIWQRDREGLYESPRLFLEAMHPADLDQYLASIENYHTKGRAYECEYRIVGTGGTQRWIHERGYPIADELGDVVLMTGICTDITERRSAEEKLRESEERFRNLAGMLPEAIFETNSDLKIVYANQRAFDMLGYSPKDLADGLHAFEMLAPEDRERAQAHFSKRVAGEKPGSTEYLVLRKDGSTLPVLFHANSIIKNGELAGLRGVFVDISEQKRAEGDRRSLEAQVQHAQKLDSLGILAGGIAHDFNNLLMGVLGNAEMALVELPKASPVRASIKGVQTSAMRAAELAQQMLAYSGKGQFIVKPVSLSEVVREMGTLLTASVTKKTTLSYKLDEMVPAIEADVAQVRQVVLNLITNAVEALEDRNGIVTVKTGVMEVSADRKMSTLVAGEVSEGTYSFLEVSDNGVGMNKETASKMFDPFFTTKFTGRGLGLAALFGIVRGHKGAIQVDSEVGKGTTVKILFPCTDRPADSPRESGLSELEAPVHGLILLVDDEQTVLEVGGRMLKKAGYEVKTAREGNEAIEVFKKHSKDIDGVVLDLTMPNMDGEETFVELQKIRKDVPVLLSSGYSVGDVEARITTTGFAGFLQKPYRMNGLLRALRKALAKGG